MRVGQHFGEELPEKEMYLFWSVRGGPETSMR